MCLYVDEPWLDPLFDDGWRRARKAHQCNECRRTIDPGEAYRFWVGIDSLGGDGLTSLKMCAHCWETIEVGAAITGCPKSWWWGSVHDLDEEMGFVGNVLHDDGHDLTDEQRDLMLATVEGRKRQWRGDDGALLPVPAIDQEVAAE